MLYYWQGDDKIGGLDVSGVIMGGVQNWWISLLCYWQGDDRIDGLDVSGVIMGGGGGGCRTGGYHCCIIGRGMTEVMDWMSVV